MNPFNDKYFVFIISAGRTGTKYFGTILEKIIDNSFSVHEPDVLSGVNVKLIKQVKQFGFYNMIPGRILGISGIRNLSERYLGGKISDDKLVQNIRKHRENFYKNIDEKLIIESYYGWYGCIPAIRKLYKNYKIVIITRDPKDWVTSNMNWQQWYGKKDWVNKLNAGRINPSITKDEFYKNKWRNFNRFQKLCWAYQFIYNNLLKNSFNDINIKVFKYEDLFIHKEKYSHLENLIQFIVNFDDAFFNYQIPINILEKRINKNISSSFPIYKSWDKKLTKQYLNICGEIQNKLNY